MPRIHQLPLLLANQIAAGEVVERTASVVKELIENSIDAGAKNIQIDIEKGGMRLIRIRDDGCGIHKDDLALALSPHATSKIKHFDDLQAIASLGFRGEALASIASVSRLSICSKVADDTNAWRANVAGKEMKVDIQPASHPQGTTIDVEDLFFNTPVRRNFLRTEKTEFSHIEDIVKKIALSHFNIGFTLRHNQRDVLQSRASEDKTRIKTICGQNFLKNSTFIEFSAVGFTLWGWLGLPEYGRSQTDLQYFYVNKRVVRDRLLGHAMRQAYNDLLYEGRHACYVLFLDIDPNMVDVNVHPTKHEVRFRDSRLIHDFVAHHIRQALVPQEAEQFATSTAEGSASYAQPSDYDRAASQSSAVREPAVSHYSNMGDSSSESDLDLSSYITIADRYLFLKVSTGIEIYDRVKLRYHYALSELPPNVPLNKVHSQPLLIPKELTLKEIDVEKIEKMSERLDELGFVISVMSPTNVVVRKAPGFLRQFNMGDCLDKLFDGFLTTKSTDESAHLIATVYSASHTNALAEKEITLLLSQKDAKKKECFKAMPKAKIEALFSSESPIVA